MYSEFKVIDIGHKGYSIDKALVELEVAVSDCIFSEKTRVIKIIHGCLLYTSPSPRDRQKSRMPSSA